MVEKSEEGKKFEELGRAGWYVKVRDANEEAKKWETCAVRWRNIKKMADKWRGFMVVRWVRAWASTVEDRFEEARKAWEDHMVGAGEPELSGVEVWSGWMQEVADVGTMVSGYRDPSEYVGRWAAAVLTAMDLLWTGKSRSRDRL